MIESHEYESARRGLAANQIVQAMALDVRGMPRGDMAHDDGTPRFSFMQAANSEFAARGGVSNAHLGAVAEAILRVLDGMK